MVSTNPCVGPFPRIKIYFSLLSICTDELISTPKIRTFLPTLLSGNENSEWESNPIPQQVHMYLSRSAYLANLTPPNKQSFQVKSEFEFYDHVSNSQTIKEFIFGGVQVAFFCFKQFPLNIKQKFEFSYHLIMEVVSFSCC